MSVALLMPLGLTALAALLVPLLLHLNRRQEQKRTPFAALRWVRGPVRPRRRLRLEQWPLLLLRALIVVALAVLLAAPARRGESTAATDLVAVVPGVDPAQARNAFDASSADWRWLQPGFPPLTAEASTDGDETASLLRELDTELPAATRLHVIAPPILRGLDGGAIRLSRDVDWRIVNGAPAAPPTTPSPLPQRVSLRADADAPGASYLRAAIAAANRAGAERYRLTLDAADAPITDDTKVVFWLDGEPSAALQQWIAAGGTALVDAGPRDRGDVVARDAEGAPLLRAEPLGRGRLLRVAAPIAPATLPAVLDADFPVRLLSPLQPTAPPPDRANASAMRPIAGALRADPAPQPLDSALILCIALLVVAERAVSLRAARRRA